MFKNMKIGMKLGLGFGSLLVMMTIVAIIGIIRLADMLDAMDKIAEDRVPKVVMVNEILNRANDNRAWVRNILLASDPTEVKKNMDNIVENRKKLAELYVKLEKSLNSEEDKALFKAMMDVRAPYVESTKKVMELGSAGKKDEAYVVLQGETRELQRKFFDVR